MSTACATSLTRMEEEKRDGVERNRGARWTGRKMATRAGFTFLIHMQGESTRAEIANGSTFMFRAGHTDSSTMRSLTTWGARNNVFV